MVGFTFLLVLALPTPPTLLRDPPLTVVVVLLIAVELRPVLLELLEREVPLLTEELRDVPLLLEREVLALLRLLELLEREVLALLRLLELLEREVLALLRLLELELLERLAELPERLLLELLIVPPTALETDEDDELRLPLLTEELRELPEEERDALDEDDDERDEVWLEEERLLPPLRDWALTVQGVSAIATAAAAESASL